MDTPTTNKKSSQPDNDEIGSARILPGGQRESTVWSDDRRREGYGALGGSTPPQSPPGTRPILPNEIPISRTDLPEYTPDGVDLRRRQSPLVWGAIAVIMIGGVFAVSRMKSSTPTKPSTSPAPSATSEGHGAAHATATVKHTSGGASHAHHTVHNTVENSEPVVRHPAHPHVQKAAEPPRVAHNEHPAASAPVQKPVSKPHETAEKQTPKHDDSNARADKFFNDPN